MNCNPTIHFSDGTKVKKEKAEKYLGGKLSAKGTNREELSNRIGTAALTAKKLENFWKKTSAPKKVEITSF